MTAGAWETKRTVNGSKWDSSGGKDDWNPAGTGLGGETEHISGDARLPQTKVSFDLSGGGGEGGGTET